MFKHLLLFFFLNTIAFFDEIILMFAEFDKGNWRKFAADNVAR